MARDYRADRRIRPTDLAMDHRREQWQAWISRQLATGSPSRRRNVFGESRRAPHWAAVTAPLTCLTFKRFEVLRCQLDRRRRCIAPIIRPLLVCGTTVGGNAIEVVLPGLTSGTRNRLNHGIARFR